MRKKIWSEVLHLFFPRLCGVCREALVEGEEQICLRCLCALPHTEYLREADNPLFRLFIGKARIEKATAWLHYSKGGKTQTLVHACKYYGHRSLAYVMGRECALALGEWGGYARADMLVPVPIHPRKQRQRGYNQSEWLCRGMGAVWDIPVNTGALRRKAYAGTQTSSKTLYDRWINVREDFVVDDAAALAGKDIVLVDDVVTSGATLSVCAEKLLKVPGVRVSILCLSAVV